MTTLPLWTFFPNCLGTCSIFTMLIKLLYVCCAPFMQAACTRPLSGYPLGRFALCFVAGKGSANPFSRHFIGWILIWSLLTGSSPEQRVVAKARLVFFMCMLTYLYTRSNDAPLCFRVATTCTVLLLR